MATEFKGFVVIQPLEDVHCKEMWEFEFSNMVVERVLLFGRVAEDETVYLFEHQILGQ